MIPWTETVFMTAENAVVEEPLEAPTKGLVDRQYIDKTVPRNLWALEEKQVEYGVAKYVVHLIKCVYQIIYGWGQFWECCSVQGYIRLW